MNINSILNIYESSSIFSNYEITSTSTASTQSTTKNSEVDSYQPSQVTTFMPKDMYDYSSNFSKLSKIKNEVNSINTSGSAEIATESNTDAPNGASGGTGGSTSSGKSEGETKTEIKNINGQLYKVVTTTYEDGTTETKTTALGSIKSNNNNGEVSDTADLVEALTM